jgi:hypothetical protein
VTLPKIKIVVKKVKVKHSHSLPHLGNHYNSERADLSRGILDAEATLRSLD